MSDYTDVYDANEGVIWSSNRVCGFVRQHGASFAEFENENKRSGSGYLANDVLAWLGY